MGKISLLYQKWCFFNNSVGGNCNPTPSDKPAVFIPITCSLIFNNGPPEFPGLIGASVWMASGIEKLADSESKRLVWLTMSVVIVLSKPYGFPIAIT